MFMKKYIANIVSTDGSEKKRDIFNIVGSVKDIDPKFPTMIVGWDTVKDIYPDANILDWKIDDMTYWTHRKNIKRDRYLGDMKRFKSIVTKMIDTYVKYVSYSLFIEDRNTTSALIGSFYSGHKKFGYISGDEMYVFYPDHGKVLGISLYEADYIGIGRNTFIDEFKKSGNRIVYNEYDIPFDIKDNLANKKYLIPFLVCLFESR